MTLTINLSRVKNNYLRLKESLPQALIFYAIKANYDKQILKTLSNLDCGAEVCSEYEYTLARKAGFKRIMINGFVKPLKCFMQNAESISQEIRGLRGARMRIKQDSKVGLSEDEILCCHWDCISFHTSRARINEWKELLDKAIILSEKTRAKYINAGGGINQERINELKKIKKKIIIEPGRELVENAGELTSKVLAVKGNNVIISTGINFFNKLSMSKYNIDVVGREQDKRTMTYQVCGPIPTDIDSIGNYNLPEVKAGDTLRIKNCGAYTLSTANNWTRLKPRIKYD
ncbi:MAG: hypothetical protein WC307_02010 [Candidatus Nanoarchaeia archaeon]|jgi:diaminopimelate decarboxylase